MTSSIDGKRLPLPYLRGELAASWLTTIRRLGAVGANKETGVNRAVAREGAKPHPIQNKETVCDPRSVAERFADCRDQSRESVSKRKFAGLSSRSIVEKSQVRRQKSTELPLSGTIPQTCGARGFGVRPSPRRFWTDCAP